MKNFVLYKDGQCKEFKAAPIRGQLISPDSGHRVLVRLAKRSSIYGPLYALGNMYGFVPDAKRLDHLAITLTKSFVPDDVPVSEATTRTSKVYINDFSDIYPLVVGLDQVEAVNSFMQFSMFREETYAIDKFQTTAGKWASMIHNSAINAATSESKDITDNNSVFFENDHIDDFLHDLKHLCHIELPKLLDVNRPLFIGEHYWTAEGQPKTSDAMLKEYPYVYVPLSTTGIGYLLTYDEYVNFNAFGKITISSPSHGEILTLSSITDILEACMCIPQTIPILARQNNDLVEGSNVFLPGIPHPEMYAYRISAETQYHNYSFDITPMHQASIKLFEIINFMISQDRPNPNGFNFEHSRFV